MALADIMSSEACVSDSYRRGYGLESWPAKHHVIIINVKAVFNCCYVKFTAVIASEGGMPWPMTGSIY